MALFNPAYALLIPTLFFITIPLAIFATFTTTIAFSLLIIRVLVVYLDIVLSFLPQSLRASSSRALHQNRQLLSHDAGFGASPTSSSPLTRRSRRRRSSASLMSTGSLTPVSERGLGLIPSVGAERDFEGVGGWRDDGDDADEVWLAVNPRADMSERRNHHRTPSSTVTTPGEGGLLMMKGRTSSPETRTLRGLRARTPTGPRVMFGAESYFPPITPSSPQASKKKMTAQGTE
ncbi:hypothetical protein N3K66_003409 [Trichothecium roseum]|uniref:Uncharacterized protein n=1 Tax=Trichothecium roseum TaxID=47278 RepID=A0ACC0V747_9HYPO|nr:hypothetical protein N3K66_003409 [Trichothecium roseum]